MKGLLEQIKDLEKCFKDLKCSLQEPIIKVSSCASMPDPADYDIGQLVAVSNGSGVIPNKCFPGLYESTGSEWKYLGNDLQRLVNIWNDGAGNIFTEGDTQTVINEISDILECDNADFDTLQEIADFLETLKPFHPHDQWVNIDSDVKHKTLELTGTDALKIIELAGNGNVTIGVDNNGVVQLQPTNPLYLVSPTNDTAINNITNDSNWSFNEDGNMMYTGVTTGIEIGQRYLGFHPVDLIYYLYELTPTLLIRTQVNNN